MTLLFFVTVASLSAAPDQRALIIGNNLSSTLGRSSLQYADDDAVRYQQTFSLMMDAANITLLARFDRDTAQLFSKDVVPNAPPSRAAVLDALASLESAARDAHARGVAFELSFVFAGHGDVNEGEGFIELEDGRLTATELRQWLLRIDADDTHLFLDSCNSYAMVASRKPGGQRFSTPNELAQQVRGTLPKVGVFLSTSANAESYEWSELQSGIFSHIVRSGLAGAADANADGAISYRELRAFVAIASQNVKNPSLRPQVLARGPAGDDDRILFRARTEGAVAISGAAPNGLRITLKDANGIRWVDANFAAGTSFVIRVPTQVAAGMVVHSSEGDRALPLHGASVSYESLPLTPDRGLSARGIDASLAALFETPFGSSAIATLEDESKAAGVVPGAPALLGVTDQEFDRLGQLVERLASEQRSRRASLVVSQLVMGGALAAVGTVSLATSSSPGVSDAVRSERILTGIELLGGGVLGAALGASLGTVKKEQETFYEDRWQSSASSRAGRLQLVALTEVELLRWQREWKEARARAVPLFVIMAALNAVNIALGVMVGYFGHTSYLNFSTVFGGALLAQSLTYFSRYLSRDASEQMVDDWLSGRPLNGSDSLSLAPMVLPQGLGLAFGGTF